MHRTEPVTLCIDMCEKQEMDESRREGQQEEDKKKTKTRNCGKEEVKLATAGQGKSTGSS